MSKLRRGEVYYASLGPTIGSEQGGTRPVVIIQNDVGNKHSPTVIVAPLTTRDKKAYLPTHIHVGTSKGMPEDSMILLEQLRTIDKQRIKNFVCQLSGEVLEQLNKALVISLGLKKNQEERKGGAELNELQVFNSEEFGNVRTVMIDGEPWLISKDVASVLGYQNARDAVMKHVEDEDKGLAECDTPGGPQKLSVINESGLYSLVFGSKMPKATKFKRWVTSEVLPTLRKTGSYQMQRMTPEEMMRVQLGMIDGHEERISRLENTMNIDYGQQRVLEKEVAKVVIESLGGRDAPAYRDISKKVFSECNHDIKDYFNVNSRNNIPRLRFDDAVEYIRNWQPCSNTRMAIRECNAQHK